MAKVWASDISSFIAQDRIPVQNIDEIFFKFFDFQQSGVRGLRVT